MELEITITVDVDYTYIKGTKDYFSHSFGNWLPGDPDELQIKSVKIGDIDIADQLDAKTIELIEDAALEEASQEE